MTLPASKIAFSEKIALHVGEAAGLSGLGRSSLYKLLGSGRLETVKIGGRRLILRESLDRLLGVGQLRPNKAEISRNPAAVAAMRRELNLEFVHECSGFIRIHAELGQTFAEIGDPTGVCYALRCLFAHAKAAYPVFVELRDGPASKEGPPR